MDGIILVKPGSTLILQSDRMLEKEKAEELRKWFKDAMDLDVKIIDGRFKIVGVEEVAKEFAKAFYNSKKWKQCRAAYIAHRQAIDGGLCESCHEAPGYIVHHKIELTPDNINDPDIASRVRQPEI